MIKTSDLTGYALNYAVILAKYPKAFENKPSIKDIVKNYPYSTDWVLAGPIIDREFITVGPYHGDGGKPTGVFQAYMGWDDDTFDPLFQADGPTSLIAAMRCFVSSKLGDEVEVPDELC